MRNHTSLVFVAVIVLCLSVVQPALGAGPTKEPAPSDPISFPAGLVCDFPLRIEAERSKASMKIFANGRVMISGFFLARVTNLNPGGRSITFNNSGAVTLTPNADGSLNVTARGQLLFYFFPEDVGGARLLRTTGIIRETLSADNVVTAFSHSGRAPENLCVTLAD